MPDELNVEVPEQELVGFDENNDPIVSTPGAEQAPTTDPEPAVQEAEPSVTDATQIQRPDVSDLSPEAQQAVEEKYKSMQADYTRKTQEVAETRNSMDMERQKAQILDNLMSNSGFRRVATAVRDGQLDADSLLSGGQPAQETTPDMDPDTKQYVDNRLHQYQAQMQSQTQAMRADMEAKEFVAKHPDWQQCQSGIKGALDRIPNLTLEDAYRVARYDMVSAAYQDVSKQLSGLRGEKREALQVAPGGESRGAYQAEPADTVEQAAAQALNELRRQGFKFPVS